MDINPGYKYVEKVTGNIQWYMMQSKVIFSSIFLKLKNENNEKVSFNGQSVTFRLSVKEF